MEQGPDQMADAIVFVLLSIRQQFATLPKAVADVRKQGDKSAFLWGAKSDGHAFVQANKEDIYGNLFDAGTVGFIDYLASEVPGLGIVKSAFVAQMYGHEVACMDTRNLVDAGFGLRSFRGFKFRDGCCVVKPETRERRIAEYVQVCIQTGGAQHWWDHWCTGIAPSMAMPAERVSALHCECVIRG